MFDPNVIAEAALRPSSNPSTAAPRKTPGSRRGAARLGLIATVLSVCSACGDRRIIFCNEGVAVEQGGCPGGSGGTGAGTGGGSGTGGAGGSAAGTGGSFAGFGGVGGTGGAAGAGAGTGGAAGTTADAGLPSDAGEDAAAQDASSP